MDYLLYLYFSFVGKIGTLSAEDTLSFSFSPPFAKRSIPKGNYLIISLRVDLILERSHGPVKQTEG